MACRKRKGGTGGTGPAQFKLLRKIVKPRFLLITALFICWDSSNGFDRNSKSTSFSAVQGPGPLRTRSLSNRHSNLAHRYPVDLHQMQAPLLEDQEEFLVESPSPLDGKLLVANGDLDETDSNRGGLLARKVQENGLDDGKSSNNLVGGIGNGEMIEALEEEVKGMKRKKKQDCGMPTVAARSFYGPSLLKRSYFANTPEEVAEKEHVESRMKREISKRNDFGDGPLPWTCETKYEWEDKGADHYPRFVRTAECKSRFCFNGFFRCKPRRYKTKVLKRLTGSEVASCEEDDVSLPESLRSTWKFVTVTINLCCDCTTRVPGVDP